MEFSVSPTAGTPIYQQLSEQVCSAVARGQLRPDQRLPSVRELSQSLVVNPNTIARAYTELERLGVLYTRPGMGVFVARERPAISPQARRERLLAGLDRVLVEAACLGCAVDEVIELVHERAGLLQWSQTAPQSS